MSDEEQFLKVDASGRVWTSRERREALLDEFERGASIGLRSIGLRDRPFIRKALTTRTRFCSLLPVRQARLKAPPDHQAAYYHCISRVVNREFVVGEEEKEMFVRLRFLD